MVELFVMCQTVFQKFSEEKPREKLKKQKKKQKKQFSRGIGKQKKCKTKKTSRKPKNPKKTKSWGGGGGQTRVSKYFFFCFSWFSRGFFLVLHFLLSKTSGKLFFFDFFWFFWFSRGFCTFSKGPSPKILKMSFLICSSRLYFSFVYCYAFFGRNSALMLLFFISCVAFHI